jgi:predicted dehydrogenase/MoaA/NifB/PqqE/SkfB family radical SAM enzyme
MARTARPQHGSSLEIGVAGLGEWGQRAILGTLLDPGRFPRLRRLHLVAGHNHEEIAARFAADARVAVYQSGELDAVLNDPAVSAVLICTPDHTHHALVKAALHAGKHVFVEKAFVLEASQASELVALAHAKRSTLEVGYEYMYDPRFVALKEALDLGHAGTLEEIDLDLLNRRTDPAATPKRYGTSVVQHHVTHLLSILQLLLGNRAARDLEIVRAGEDSVQLSFGYAGCRVRLASAVNLPQERNYRVIRVKGSRSVIELDFDGSNRLFRVTDAPSRTVLSPASSAYPRALADVPPESCVERELAEFFRCCDRRETPVSGGQNALHLVQLAGEIEHAYFAKRAHDLRAETDWAARYSEELDARLRALAGGDDGGPRTAGDPGCSWDVGVDRTRRVVEHLAKTPHACAAEVMDAIGLSRDELKVAYRAIQGSPMSRELLRRGPNHDQLDVVDSFFHRGSFEATFFVGLGCPYKCVFCRMLMASLERKEGHLGQGERDQRGERFAIAGPERLSFEVIRRALDELAQLNRERRVTVKISGGLEPMTDAPRVAFLIEEARRRGLPVCVYSNGILMKTPELRRSVLQATDVRISLNAVNDQQFQAYYLAGARKSREITFGRLMEILQALVRERKLLRSPATLGINYVVLRDNVSEMTTMAELCAALGVTYVNFSADYFDDFDERTYLAIARQIDRIEQKVARRELGELRVRFGGALLAGNTFAAQPEGALDPTEISRFKVFIDPAGRVTPVHEGTYPVRNGEGAPSENPYVIGRLSERTGLLDVLAGRRQLPEIGFRYLAPLELFLGLELMREARDSGMGIEPEVSPYRRDSAAPPPCEGAPPPSYAPAGSSPLKDASRTRRARTPSARPSSTRTVSSQPMQPSVMLWP